MKKVRDSFAGVVLVLILILYIRHQSPNPHLRYVSPSASSSSIFASNRLHKIVSPDIFNKRPMSSMFVNNLQTESPSNCVKMIVVLTFPLLYQPKVRLSHPDLSLVDLDRRMEEYISSLQSTLMHVNVEEIHFLFDDVALPSYVESKIYSNGIKLKFHRVYDSHKTSNIFEYVFTHLQGKLVMVTQADCYPERGFHLINKTVLSKNRLMYALTRHGHLEDSCDLSGEFCDQKTYVGSHDAYVFVPQGRFPLSASVYLHKKTTTWGIDLLIVWVFENILRYRVLNPCKVIYIYHRHCSFVRDVKRVRVNTHNTTGWSPPTDKLV
ncbi:hypothetical protein SNE40_015993 [Patella caerulea]|uniref:Uncharacterized protein n=1 Tax=Patella caerulea TaxID=87958 RepID=A0AAN8J809_PATCE